MKILKLDLLAYGMFTNYTLDFNNGNPLTIIYGPNEAGKSTALRAITSLLFGIEHRSSDNFLHSSNMRIGGSLQHSDGEIFDFLRRKGKKDTFLDINGKPLDEIRLQKFLPGLDKNLFVHRFGINHEMLVRGAEEILKGGGELGKSLFAADFGGISLHKVIEEINTEAEKLFKPRGGTQQIILHKKKFDEINKKIKDLSRESGEYPEIINNLDIKQQEKQQLSEQIRLHSKEIERLNRIKSSLPIITQLKERQQQQNELGVVTPLPEDFTERRHKVQQELEVAIRDREIAEKTIKRIDEELSGISVPRELIEQGDTINRLYLDLGNYGDGQKNLSELKHTKLEHETKAIAILEDLPISKSIDEIINMRPNRTLRDKIQTLVREFGKHGESLKNFRDNRDTYKTELERIDKELHKLSEHGEIDTIDEKVEQIRQQGNIEAQLKKQQRTADAKKEKIETEIQRLGLWSGSIEQLNILPLPLSETIDKYIDDFRNIEKREILLLQSITEQKKTLKQIENEMLTIQRNGDIYSEEELLQLRKHRDNGWSLIKRSWLGSEVISEEKIKYCQDEELSETYEKSVSAADEAADNMRVNSKKVAQFNEKKQRCAEITDTLHEFERQIKDIDTEKAKLIEKWNTIWNNIVDSPLSPPEMKTWLQDVNSIRNEIHDYADFLNNIKETQEELNNSRNELLTVLTDLRIQGNYENESLSSMIRQCTHTISEIKKTNQNIQHFRIQYSAAADKVEEAEKALKSAEETMEQWKNIWSDTIDNFDFPEQLTPDDVLAVISGIEDIYSEHNLANEKEYRIKEISEFAEEFQAKVTAFTQEFSPDLAGLPPDQTVERLHSQLNEANKKAVQYQQLEQQRIENNENYDNASIKIKESEQKLRDLCTIAQCESPIDFQEIEYRFKRNNYLAGQIESIKQNLSAFTVGKELEEFIQDVGEEDPDMLTVRLSELGNDLENLEKKRGEIDQTIGNLQQQLSQIDGSAEAAEAAAEKQELIAAMREDAQKYIRFHLAAKLLNRELERYREENQGPLVRRAGKLFSALTLQSFSGLRTDFNENDEPVLKGIRNNGDLIDVDGMSDGARDQLFLSLRIASLEKYLESNEPIPFIVDDILIKFDAKRAQVTFQVLSDLSAKTQIIFFTHNIHLLDAASDIVGTGSIGKHMLNC